MEIQFLSKHYRIKKLEEKDVQIMYDLCEKNPQYYQHCPPPVSIDGMKEMLNALPVGKSMEDKYVLGFWEEDTLVAIMDLILGYPKESIAIVGFFMMSKNMQGNGIGSKIITEACDYLRDEYDSVMLGYVMGNEQSKQFWLKNQFTPTGTVVKTEEYDIVSMIRKL